jgi:hypothetical protein
MKHRPFGWSEGRDNRGRLVTLRVGETVVIGPNATPYAELPPALQVIVQAIYPSGWIRRIEP